MANDRGTGKISEDKAALVLDRAAKLDAGNGRWLDVTELREAALEAGISLEAFESALAEVEASAVHVPHDLPVTREGSDEVGSSGALPTWARRWAMFASGLFLGGLGLLLFGPFGMDGPGIVFALLIAVAVALASVVRNSRRRDVLEFEIELGLLWLGLTFLLMLSGEPDRVLATMTVLGAIAGVTGGAVVALTGSSAQPRELPDKTS